MTKDGVIVIHAQRFRTQERNRADAIDRLLELLREAMTRPTPRRPTRPTAGSKQRRLEGKKRRSAIKARRGSAGFDACGEQPLFPPETPPTMAMSDSPKDDDPRIRNRSD